MEKNNQVEHDLRVLTELDLCRRIRGIKDGNFPNEEKIIREVIELFERTLPERVKRLPNCHEIIVDVLNQERKMENEYKEQRSKDEGEER